MSRDRRVRACRTLGRTHPSLLVYLPATQGQRRGNPAPVLWCSTENGSRIPPPRAVPGSGSSRLGVRGREELERRVRGRELPPSRPHALRRCSRSLSPPDPPLTTVLAGHHEVHLLGDRHRVVTDALVVARDQRELHRGVERAARRARAPPSTSSTWRKSRFSSSSMVSSMSASAAAHDGSRSAKALTATRSCTTTWRPSRSTSRAGGGVEPAGEQAPGGLGHVDHEVGAALELVGDAHGHADEPEVGGAHAGQAEDAQALVLDRVAERVDGVVVGHDPVGARRGRRRGGPRCPTGPRRA